MPTMIKSLQPEDRPRWDAYVATQSQASFFHLAGWKSVIEQAFGHSGHYLYAEQQGEIVGILPLIHLNSRLFGNALISNAFCVYGGIVADDAAVFTALCDHAQQLARDLGVDHLELRNRQQSHGDWPHKPIYVTFIKPLEATEDANFRAIPGKRRSQVRAGIRAGLTARVSDDVERFYRCYAESVRNLGTPIFAQDYFQLLVEEFGAAVEIMLIEKRDKVLAAVMSFYFRDQVLPYYAGGTRAARRVNANDFMYWRLMCRALERGCRQFDFGRSKLGTGACRYKRYWGFQPQPLFYEIDLVRAECMPDVNPLNPKYRLFIAAWKRLPLALSMLIGPWLAKDLG